MTDLATFFIAYRWLEWESHDISSWPINKWPRTILNHICSFPEMVNHTCIHSENKWESLMLRMIHLYICSLRSACLEFFLIFLHFRGQMLCSLKWCNAYNKQVWWEDPQSPLNPQIDTTVFYLSCVYHISWNWSRIKFTCWDSHVDKNKFSLFSVHKLTF